MSDSLFWWTKFAGLRKVQRKAKRVRVGARTASRGRRSCTDGLQRNKATLGRGGEGKIGGGSRGGAKKGEVDVAEMVVRGRVPSENFARSIREFFSRGTN